MNASDSAHWATGSAKLNEELERVYGALRAAYEGTDASEVTVPVRLIIEASICISQTAFVVEGLRGSINRFVAEVAPEARRNTSQSAREDGLTQAAKAAAPATAPNQPEITQ